jgi:hypothetical protein
VAKHKFHPQALVDCPKNCHSTLFKDSWGLVLGTVLLDSGSETTLIRSGFAKQLGVQGQRQNLTVDGQRSLILMFMHGL